jgi:hypothetical protein
MMSEAQTDEEPDGLQKTIESLPITQRKPNQTSNQNALIQVSGTLPSNRPSMGSEDTSFSMVTRQPVFRAVRPTWHPPWKLMRVSNIEKKIQKEIESLKNIRLFLVI